MVSPEKKALAALVLVSLGLSVACGLPARTRNLFGGKVQMEVTVSPSLNGNTPVPVDVVVVYDKGLLEDLQGLSARQWFEQREQILRDNPKRLDTWSWEWVPGQEVATQVLEFDLGTAGGLIFADYLEAGDHRLRFDPHQHFRLSLGEASFTTSALQ